MLKQEKQVTKHLLKWYSYNKRDLPWRQKYKNNLPNAYHVLVSEYMLQQTTVNTVKKRFENPKPWTPLTEHFQITLKKSQIRTH